MKIILAYSGGLDTSFAIPYLIEKYKADIISVTVDTGGFTKNELKELDSKSKQLGSIKHYTIQAKDEFYEKNISYLIKANALRGGVYPLCASASRYIQAEKIVEIAKKESADTIAHGSTGAGSDQVRYDVAFKVLAPKMKIITPYRDENLSREHEYNFLKAKGFEFKLNKEYSINESLIGVTIGGKETNVSMGLPPETVNKLTLPIEKSSDIPETLTIEYNKGLPVKLNNKSILGVGIINELNKIGKKHSIGKTTHLGDTIIGIKGRIVVEAPAVQILIKAHQELEKLVLTKLQLFWKNHLSNLYADMVHEAKYYDPLTKDLEKFIDSTQKNVIGIVKIKLFKGNIIIIGSQSKFSLMNQKIATYAEDNSAWSGIEAKGFCKLYGIQSVLTSSVNNNES